MTLEECPICGDELEPLPWGDNDRFVCVHTFDEMRGLALCNMCGVAWRIDFKSLEISLHAFKGKCDSELCLREHEVGWFFVSDDDRAMFECDTCSKKKRRKLLFE